MKWVLEGKTYILGNSLVPPNDNIKLAGTYDFKTWKIKYKNQLIASGVSSLATGHI